MRKSERNDAYTTDVIKKKSTAGKAAVVHAQLKPAPATSEAYRNSYGGKLKKGK